MRLAVIREHAQLRWARTVPSRFRHAPTTHVHPAVERWVRTLFDAACATRTGKLDTGPSLVLTGGTGTGKTHAGWWAIGRLARAGVLAAWEVTTAADLYAALRPRHGVDSETEFERYATTPLLMIDDVGAFKRTEWTVEVDYRLVNYRYNAELPTLVTTNLPAGRTPTMPPQVLTLADVLEDRVLSRLSEMAGGDAVALDGPDRRMGDPR